MKDKELCSVGHDLWNEKNYIVIRPLAGLSDVADLAVSGLLVVAAQQIGDGPDERGKVGIAHGVLELAQEGGGWPAWGICDGRDE